MEKLKNILNPGKATDDEILYGSGRSNDPVHSGNTGMLTGEGSHFDNSRNTPSGMGLGSSNIGEAPTTAGPHSSDLANKADPRVDSNLDGSQTMGNTTGAYSSTSRSSMPGAFEPESNPYTTQELDPRLGGPSTTSGLSSNTTGTGYNSTDQSGITGQTSTGATDRHLGRDAAVVGTAGAVGEGIHHHRENERENVTTSTTTPAAYDKNSGVRNSASTTGTQPHGSSLLNKLDPRTESNTSGAVSDTGSGPHYGRDAAVLGTAGAVGEGVHHHRENERENTTTSTAMPATFTDNRGIANIGSNTGAQPHSSSLLNKLDPRLDSSTSGTASNTEPGPHYGRDAAVIGTAGAVGEGVHHHQENKTENLQRSNDAPGTYNDSSRTGNISSTTGTQPHSSSLLNKLDPRVDSSTTGAVKNTEPGSNYGRDTAAVGGAAAVGEGIHHHRENERENVGSSAYTGTTPSGAGSAYYGGPAGVAVSDTSGPHVTSTANRLDPAINTSGQPIERASEHDPMTGGGGLAADEAHGNNKHHLGRDAAIGAGGVGLAEHEHRKHEREREVGAGGTTGGGSSTATYGDNSTYGTTTGSTGTGTATGTTDTTGPHSSKLLNKLDPRVDSSNARIEDNSGSSHHYGRDAAIGAGGVGLAEHEHRKHEREREAGAGNTVSDSNTGIGSSTGTYADNSAYTGSTGSTTHHYGRDAAVGAGGVGLAEHERRKHERERDTGVGTSAALASNRAAYADDPSYTGNSGNTGTAGALGTTDHHYGRDAAGGAGGIGLAEHEHRKHEREREAGVGADTGVGPNTGLGSNTTGYTTDPNSTGSTDHHYGRDAAIGIGGAGLAEDEHRKHERVRDSGIAGVADTTAASDPSTGPAPNTAGPHSRDWMNKLDPRVKSNPNTADNGPSSTRNTTHGERDAVVGTGLAGAGYEAEKHQTADSEGLPSLHHTGRDASAVGAATALDEPEKARLRGVRGERDNNYNQGPVEPGYATTASGATNSQSPYDTGYNPTTTGPMDQQSRDHHLGRDAAAAGVVGGAAYEAEKHHRRDKDLTADEKEQKRELKREEKEAKIEQKEEKKHHGLLSFLHRDKNKKYTKEEEEEFDRQEREDNSHGGRGATLASGAAVEAEKHHGHADTASGDLDTMKPLPVAPGNHGIGTGEGTQNALIMERKRGEGYDMDTTSGAGQPLAAGNDAYPPAGTSLGDKLHGVERNRGVNDGLSGPGYNTSSDTTGTGTHHLGRDAAVGAGGLGLAEHEHRKHEEDRGTGVGSSGLGYGDNDPITNMLGANTENNRSAGYAGATAAKPNVLHKDPPANHPAARAMAAKSTDIGYPTGTTNTGNY